MNRVDEGKGVSCKGSVRYGKFLVVEPLDTRTGRFIVETVKGTSSVCNVIHPLTRRSVKRGALERIRYKPFQVLTPSYDSP